MCDLLRKYPIQGFVASVRIIKVKIRNYFSLWDYTNLVNETSYPLKSFKGTKKVAERWKYKTYVL